MPRIVKSFDSVWDADTAFSYLSDFSHAAQWDPGVVSAQREDEGPVNVGSAFSLTVSMGGRPATFRYEVVRLTPRQVTFHAVRGALRSQDTITVTPREGGCTVTYDAGLELTGIASVANPVLAIAFRRVVDRAAASLGARLATQP